MAQQIQFRGDTTANLALVAPAAREIGVDTTKKTLVVGDGVKFGGFPLARASDLPINAADASTIIAEGDSHTYGYGTTTPASNNFMSLLANMRFGATKKAYFNFAVSGNVVADLAARYVASVKPHRPTANGGDGGDRALLFLLIGGNDLGSGSSAATTVAAIAAYIATAKADGFTVIEGTIPPGLAMVPGGFEVRRQSVNASIKQGATGADIVYDSEFALPDPFDINIYQADGTHFQNVGHLMLANYLQAGLQNGGFLLTAGRRAYGANGKLDFITDLSVSAAGAIGVPNLAPYRSLVMSGFLYPSVQSELKMLFSADNGATWDTGSNYDMQLGNAQGSALVGASTTGTYASLSSGAAVGASVLNGLEFSVMLDDFNQAKRTNGTYNVFGENSVVYAGFGGMRNKQSVAFNAIQILAGSGSLSGRILMWGVKG